MASTLEGNMDSDLLGQILSRLDAVASKQDLLHCSLNELDQRVKAFESHSSDQARAFRDSLGHLTECILAVEGGLARLRRERGYGRILEVEDRESPVRGTSPPFLVSKQVLVNRGIRGLATGPVDTGG